MGWLWEGSTGARAVQLLREQPQNTVIFTKDLAARLEVAPGALHQLLANAVSLRLIKKVRDLGPQIGWKLGGGNDSATIERRKPAKPAPTTEELERRARAAQRRAARAAELAAAPPAPTFAPTDWPPRFVSTFDPAGPAYAPPRVAVDGDAAPAAAVPDADVPPWLRGLYGLPAPEIELRPAAEQPKPVQLPLFDAAEVGEGGRARWRRLDLAIPAIPRPSNEPTWRQIALIEA